MDVNFNERERMLQEQARDFLKNEVSFEMVRAMEADSLGYPPELWRKMADLGWLGMTLPEKYGGEGLSFLDLIILVEELGRVIAPTPFIPTVALAALALAEGGEQAQKQRILPKVAKGELILTAAYMEPHKLMLGYERNVVATVAHKEGDGYQLTGTKHFVQFAHVADVILTFAQDHETGQPFWLLVDQTSPGVQVKHLETTGNDHQCHVTFTKTPVPSEHAFARGDAGWKLLEALVARGAMATCASLSGAAQAVLEFTVEYAKTRVQFGRPIGTFQAVRHRCSEMAADVDGARFVTYEAAWMMSEGHKADLEISVAKSYVSDAVSRVMWAGHQSHGAIGFSEEHPMPLYSRRAKMGEALFGNANFHRERVAQELGL